MTKWLFAEVIEQPIPPLHLSIRVKAPLLLTFGVFTLGLSRWWPSSVIMGKSPRKKVMLEPRLGGRWFEIAQDGTRTVVAEVIDWEPPERVVFLWQVDAAFQPDRNMRSEVEIRFGTNEGTVVELTHDKFELMGPAYGTFLREKLAQFWPHAMDRFAARLELEALPT